jgi:Tfp pilus assembly protein FimV
MVGSSGHKGISRIDSEKNKTHGWYVRVQYLGQTHARFFSDSAHGGKDKALAKAVKHRNQIEKELGKPRTDRTVTATSSRNTSGVQGVKRIAKGGGYAYEVTWSPAPGTVHRTTVSVQKYGEDEAFRRACRIRQQKEREFYGGVLLLEIPPTPPLPEGQGPASETRTRRGRPPKHDIAMAADPKAAAKAAREKAAREAEAQAKAEAKAARAAAKASTSKASTSKASTSKASTSKAPAAKAAPKAKASAVKVPAARASATAAPVASAAAAPESSAKPRKDKKDKKKKR